MRVLIDSSVILWVFCTGKFSSTLPFVALPASHNRLWLDPLEVENGTSHGPCTKFDDTMVAEYYIRIYGIARILV